MHSLRPAARYEAWPLVEDSEGALHGNRLRPQPCGLRPGLVWPVGRTLGCAPSDWLERAGSFQLRIVSLLPLFLVTAHSLARQASWPIHGSPGCKCIRVDRMVLRAWNATLTALTATRDLTFGVKGLTGLGRGVDFSGNFFGNAGFAAAALAVRTSRLQLACLCVFRTCQHSDSGGLAKDSLHLLRRQQQPAIKRPERGRVVGFAAAEASGRVSRGCLNADLEMPGNALRRGRRTKCGSSSCLSIPWRHVSPEEREPAQITLPAGCMA